MANRTYHPRNILVDGFKVRKHPSYFVWADMLRRCYNKDDPAYQYYGGRGIIVCERWHHFRFFAQDMGTKPNKSLTIERENVHGNYEPGNCVWDTWSQQTYNRRVFSNNTTGVTGVVKAPSGSYHARMDYENVRYDIGYFETFELAAQARHEFEELYFKDKNAAIASISGERIKKTSTTKIPGVNLHKDGGYISRATINGERFYIGYFRTIEEAKNARIKFIETRTTKA